MAGRPQQANGGGGAAVEAEAAELFILFMM